MAENTFGWPEAQVWLWTGTTANQSAVAYVQNLNGNAAWGYENYQTIDNTYHWRPTAEIADVAIGAVWTYDQSVFRVANAQTAVHMKIDASGVNGSAGLILYSGRILSFSPNGAEGGPITYSLTYQANKWSAYGG